MKIQLDETYESWANRVAIHEKTIALKQLAKGIEIDVVLEEMARRVAEKLMHPILVAIRNSTEDVEYDAVAGKKQYDELYTNITSRPADHVED